MSRASNSKSKRAAPWVRRAGLFVVLSPLLEIIVLVLCLGWARFIVGSYHSSSELVIDEAGAAYVSTVGGQSGFLFLSVVRVLILMPLGLIQLIGGIVLITRAWSCSRSARRHLVLFVVGQVMLAVYQNIDPGCSLSLVRRL